MSNPWKLRAEICEIGRRMYERGLVAAFEGNLSARLGPDRVLCTPSLLCKGLLKPDDLCVVDMAGKQLAGQRRRTSEILLHLAVYRDRPDATAVVHAHPPHATAFAIAHEPVPPCVLAEVEVFLGEVPTAPYATPGTPEVAQAVAPFLRDSNALVLANHGTLSWGNSLEQALHRTEILEAYCRSLLLARLIGAPRRLSDQNLLDLLAVKERLGIPDRRSAGQDCDLCGNNLMGRGYQLSLPEPAAGAAVPSRCHAEAAQASASAASQAADPAKLCADARGGAASAASALNLDSLVQEIALRVMAAVNPRG
jgi:L-fuculose-phosphate aldolase